MQEVSVQLGASSSVAYILICTCRSATVETGMYPHVMKAAHLPRTMDLNDCKWREIHTYMYECHQCSRFVPPKFRANLEMADSDDSDSFGARPPKLLLYSQQSRSHAFGEFPRT